MKNMLQREYFFRENLNLLKLNQYQSFITFFTSLSLPCITWM